MTTHHRAKLDAIFIFFCGLIFFTLGLRHQEIIGFESRFYLFALEMWRHGLSWFPTTYQTPYPDYPATATVLIYLTAKLFGTLDKLTAVFPSAMAAAFTLSATYLIGALQERRWGWYGAGFLILTLAFLTAARTISLDMYVTAFTAWIFYFIYKAKQQAKTLPWLSILSLLIMSFAVRGPIGIVIPTGVMCVFYLLEKDWKSLVLISFSSLLILLLCTGILLNAAYHTGGSHFMQDVLRMEVSGRMQENRTPPHYFYFVESIGAYAVTYPLAILTLLGTLLPLIKNNTSPRIQFLRVLSGWVLVIMVGLSIPADKKIRYILPIAPAMALICSYLLMSVQNGYLHWLKKIFYLLCWIFPLLALGVLSVLYQKKIELNYGVLAAFFIVVQMAMLVSRNKDACFFLTVLSFFLANIFIVEKINLLSNQTRSFVQNIENMREKQHAKLIFYREGKDGLVIKYLANMQHEENPLFITDMHEIPAKPAFIITTEENFNALSHEVRQSLQAITMGKIGHDPVVVFVKRINKPAAHLQGAF